MPVNPSTPLVGGRTDGINSGNIDRILQGNVFASGIHEPEHSSILSYLYPQFYLSTMLDRLGPSEPIAQDTFSWNEMDRTRRSVTLETGASAAGPAATVAVEFSDVTEDESYAIVGDVFRNSEGLLFEVTAINSATNSNQNVTLRRLDGTNITTANDLIDGEKLGHVGNTYAEASTHPKGRLYLPDQEFNYTQILRRGGSVSGSEFTNKTWIENGGPWYWTNQGIDAKEFALDKEATLMFGTRGTAGTNKKTMRGLFDFVDTNGFEQTYASTATAADIESDLQTLIRNLMVRGCSNELTVFAGSILMERVQNALKDYAIDGALSYGSFGGNTAGLDFQAYQFMGVRLNFFYYRLFDDDSIVPPVTASASKINFSDYGMVLDFGTGGGMMPDRKIKLKHKEHQGQSRQLITYVIPGIMDPSGQNGGTIPNGNDFFSYGFFSEISLEVRGAHTMGQLRCNS